jgi:hypothetical protein
LVKLTSPHGNIRARIAVGIGMANPGGRVKKEIKNREGFLIQVFKKWKNTNIIFFSLRVSDVS